MAEYHATPADADVMAFLRGRGTGSVTVREIAAATGLKTSTVEVSLHALSVAGLICRVQQLTHLGTGRYVIRHLHAAPGECRIPLAQEFTEIGDARD